MLDPFYIPPTNQSQGSLRLHNLSVTVITIKVFFFFLFLYLLAARYIAAAALPNKDEVMFISDRARYKLLLRLHCAVPTGAHLLA